VLTNVTHEHLEFHGTFEQYRSDKAELFRALDTSPPKQSRLSTPPRFAVANADDASALYFAAATNRTTYTFSTKNAAADISLQRLESGSGGNRCEALVKDSGATVAFEDHLPGAFNAGNVLAALLVVSRLLSVDIAALAELVPRLLPVRGRMSAVQRGQPFEVLVDYAHTPSSFEAVLPLLQQRLNCGGTKSGRLIALFGSPGERDTQKRRLQGEVAARYCDIVILADEDPRGETPMAILEEIATGCEAPQGSKAPLSRSETLFLIPNRRQAIRKAFALAKQGDIVILLGKGHENSIIYADGAIDYDELTEAEMALEEAGYRTT
ncbi:MAG: UDP-N-acetylmuramyl-tripeptide synthetase, partial [Treponema sp.]|nr:UDP-N-acetylmuramyl-tripeptide synthetase [Treponema sp.]